LRGQIGVGQLAERRVHDLVARYGVEVVLGVFADILDRAEERMRHLLARLPDGVAEADGTIDDDGTSEDTARFHVRVAGPEDRIERWFTGSWVPITMPTS